MFEKSGIMIEYDESPRGFQGTSLTYFATWQHMGNKAENSKELTKKHVLVHGFENKGKFPREYRNTDPPGKPSVIKFRYRKIAMGQRLSLLQRL